MHRLRKLLRLSSPDRRLLMQAALLVGAVRLGLWLLPFRTLQRLLGRMALRPYSHHTVGAHQNLDVLPAATGMRQSGTSIDSIVWAVAMASRYIPRATCLTQALAAQVLLQQSGYPAELRLGVARSTAGHFEAHAWLESEGRVVIGGAGHERYTRLPIWSGG